MQAVHPDAVIVAAGSRPVTPPIPGIDQATQALAAYQCLNQMGEAIAIVGGGLVGCEVGLHLARHGKKVTIIEMQSAIASETFGYYRNALLNEMDHRQITQILNAKCLAFQKDGVLIEQNGGTTPGSSRSLLLFNGDETRSSST
jgi:pyruvate/2-oxoglutarate dehydrogenase complex dihydrolipoamide dehydrogenase (E3) component